MERRWAAGGDGAPAGATVTDGAARSARQTGSLSPAHTAPIARGPRETHVLSCAQQRLWFLDRLEPGACVYNVPVAMRLRGDLRIGALREALDGIVARHEVLRTTFTMGEDGPRHIVTEPAAIALPVRDLSALPEEEREAEVARVLREEACRPFDLAADPMLRALLVRAGERDHVLLLVMHHIATDGWSMGILTRELAALYTAAVDGRRADLPPLPIQYRDYARWEGDWLQSEQPAAQLAYWKGRLAGMPAMVQLPADRRRPTMRQGVRGARETAVLSRDLGDALAALSRRERATLFMTLLAAFATLLHRYAGTDDVAVGTAIAGRRRVETEPLIGFFVNTLVLRMDLGGDPSFRDLMGRVREVVVDAYDNQDLPFERLVEELRPERRASRTPLFNVMFVLQEPERRHLELPGLTVSPADVDTGTAKFDLTASVTPVPEGLRIALTYDADLYDPGTIRRMLGHYETLLAGVAVDPGRPLSQLPLLTEVEYTLVRQWNETQRRYPATEGIPALFEAQAARTPEAIAVIEGECALTYAELNARANRLAHRLRRQGVGLETAVGICLTPGLDAIVGLLGILKAGGAYLPLDPGYPRERLAFMLEDAHVGALVTRRDLLDALPSVPVPVVLLDGGPAIIESTHDPAHETTADHLAYLMYTSGSTGQPKAVAVPQRAVTRLVLGTDYVTITPADVVAQASSLTFDAATFEVWGALLNGARLAVVPRETVLSPAAFAAAIERDGVTVLFLTTALFNVMAREAPSAFKGLRTLLFGGETASPECAAAVLAHEPPGRLLHVYGPTETTTFASWYLVQRAPVETTAIPIGRPIANTRIHLLDGHLNPVPVGVPGEIHIGGPGVARGYVGRPELTCDRFIPDPFSDQPGARLYRSGDLARYLPDGNIEFLGRLDDQVKIRGHRIEPGEVEAVLRRHPNVRDVAVLAREDAPGQKRLVAYVVQAERPPASPAELRGFLQGRLPSYMIPEHIVPLHALPLTPNGKADRHALPPPEDRGRGPGAAFVEPRDALEYQLQEIWEDLLGAEPIGATDDFFDLGGHSLLAARLVEAIEAAVGRRVPLAALFERATIRHLAEAIRRQSASAPVTTFNGDGTRRPFFFLHGDFHGGGFYCHSLARALGADQPFVALHPHGMDGGPVPDSIEAMATDHLATLRTIQPHGPYQLGGHCNGGLVAFEMARRLVAQGERVEFLAVLDISAENARLRNRILRVCAESLGAARGLTRRERLARFARLRRGALALDARARYYRRRLPQLARLDQDDWAAVLTRTVARGRGWLAGVRARRSNGASCHGAPAGPSPAADLLDPSLAPGSGDTDSPETYRRLETYRLVIAGYVPRRYRGTVTLFRSGVDEERPPDLWWSLVASKVEVYWVPGDHLTSVTRHVHALGERLRACLAPQRA
jgi:amino acid adenylation domain-containing protein